MKAVFVIFVWMLTFTASMAILVTWQHHRRPTAAQLFGCEHTYINAKGEDTGECN